MVLNTNIVLVSLVLGCMFQCGCESSPSRGDDGGRLDQYDTTAADRSSPAVSSVTLLEFADQVAESLALHIPSIPEIKEKPHRVVIELGDILNDTNTQPRDFAVIRRRIFLSMVNNPQIRYTAQINESPSRIAKQGKKYEQDTPPDLLDEGNVPRESGPRSYQLGDVYSLNGTFGEIRRGGDSTYIFDMTLVNLESGEIVFAEIFEARQGR